MISWFRCSFTFVVVIASNDFAPRGLHYCSTELGAQGLEMPPKAKRARLAPPAHQDDYPRDGPGSDGDDQYQDQDDVAASHLLSFLADYDARPALDSVDRARDRRDGDGYGYGYDEEGGGSSDEDRNAGEEEDEEDDYDDDADGDDDPDGDGIDGEETPTKRAKSGLVGTPGRSTPSRRRTGTGTPSSTPRKRKAKSAAGTPSKTKSAGLIATFAAGVEQGIIRPSKADAYFLAHSRTSRTSGHSYSALAPPLSQATYERYTASARRDHWTSTSRIKTGLAIQPSSESAPTKDTGQRGGARVQLVQRLEDEFERRISQYESELDAGFNLVFYGFGSKRNALNSFARKRLVKRGTCVIVNGHYPGLTIREVLAQIEDALSVPADVLGPITDAPAGTSISVAGSSTTLSPVDRLAQRIYTYFLPPADKPKDPAATRPRTPARAGEVDTPHRASQPLYLILHNIDSPALRSPRALAILSLLACSPRIHLIASFDHLHTPLLFSHSLTNTPPHAYASTGTGSGPASGIPPTRGFNFLYHNLTTYADYTLELSHQRLTTSSPLTSLSSSTAITEEAVAQILLSVPPNALRLLKLLITRQLASLPGEGSTHATSHGASTTATATSGRAHASTGAASASGMIAPVYAVDNDILQALAREKFIAREEERYNALLGEFKDHGVILEAGAIADGGAAGAAESSAVGTAGPGGNGNNNSNSNSRWVWVPMGKSALERVMKGLEGVEV